MLFLSDVEVAGTESLLSTSPGAPANASLCTAFKVASSVSVERASEGKSAGEAVAGQVEPRMGHFLLCLTVPTEMV